MSRLAPRPLVRHSLQTDLKEIFERLKQTVLMVTHDMAEAAYFAGEIVLLMDGKSCRREVSTTCATARPARR